MPVENRCRVTDPYGYRAWRGYVHVGLDLGGMSPGKPSEVYAVADGVVQFVGWDLIPTRNGQHIGIRHPDGSLTFYGHVKDVLVRAGQKVVRGQKLATSWNTGVPTAGIHLHLEWWKDCNDHRSHFDPVNRLASYGWALYWDKTEYRLRDEWEGRSHKIPHVTVTPVVSLEKEDFMSLSVDQLKAIIREVMNESNDVPRPVDNKHTVAFWIDPETGKQVNGPRTRFDQNLDKKVNSLDYKINAIAESVGISREILEQIDMKCEGRPDTFGAETVLSHV